MQRFSLVLAILVILFTSCRKEPPAFIKVNGTQFEIKGKPYYFIGTNLWYGINLGSAGEGGDRERLKRELDHLKSLGINNLRIMAGSEGPDTEPYRMVPSLQPEAGEYNQEVMEGMDYLLNEMKSRNMYAVMCLTNFWNWSGGMPQYLVWGGAADSVPYPPPHHGGNWDTFQKFAASFFAHDKATELLNNHIRTVVTRKNSITGVQYKDDPTIMAWELANEPRAINQVESYRSWINSTAKFIKSLDQNHLVTTGSEGLTGSDYAGNNPEIDHSSNDIDYIAFHLWVENWGIFDPFKPDSTFEKSILFVREYMSHHEAVARRLNKPMVMEEFGISRDMHSHDPEASTRYRDEYFERIFERIYEYASEDNSVFPGCNFWTWSGEGRPARVGELWRPGDMYTGEPPHENQGWYSIYDKDTTTLSVIKKYTMKMKEIGTTP